MPRGNPPARTHAAAHPLRPHLRLRTCSHQPPPPPPAEAEWRTLAELSTVEQTPVALSHEV